MKGSPPRADVAIVGLGLIGGSLARALTGAGWRVAGVDRAPVLRQALRAGAIVTGAEEIETAGRARIVVLAAPLRANLALLRRLVPRLAPDAVVTDLGSVKGPICAQARRLRLRRFVGGHPMAGRERSGFAASAPDLFRDHAWILTETEDLSSLRAVRRMVRAAGARPHVMPAAEHDRVVAFLSHMPQLVAWAIEGAVASEPQAGRHRRLAGPGFRDMTRLARSPRGLWREIVSENRSEIARAMKALSRALRHPV